jgi:hypothetical protein
VEKLAFYMDCVGEIGTLRGLLCRNFHFTEIFLEKLSFYRAFGGEIGTLQRLSKYFLSTLSMFHIYLFIYCRTI